MIKSRLTIDNIVFCEDDEDDRIFFGEVMQEHYPSLKIQFLSNGIRLMELLKNFIPDLLFLDLEMPCKNGLECLVEIRDNPKLENLPVVIFSSTTRQANIQTAYDLGANLFLIKSPTYSEYASSLKAVLNLDWSKPNEIREQYCVNGRYTAFS